MPSREGVSVNVGVRVHDVGAEQVAFLKGSGARGMYAPLLLPPHLTSSPITLCLWSLPHPAARGLVGWGESPHPLGPGALLPEEYARLSRAEPALAVGSPCRNRALQLGLPSVHVGERDSGGEGVFPSFPPGAVVGRYIQKVTPQISLAVFSQPSKVRPPSILILPSSCPEPAITGSGRGGSMLG